MGDSELLWELLWESLEWEDEEESLGEGSDLMRVTGLRLWVGDELRELSGCSSVS